jgi:pyrroline-5-carboxylate reductase
MSISGHLLLVGCGKMGGAMLRGWLQRGVRPGDVTVVEPNMAPVADLAAKGVRFLDDGTKLPAELKPAVVVVAVKPQMTDAALPTYRRFTAPETVFLSIVAGRTIGYFESRFGASAALVRSMPNTPAAVGRGITVACPNRQVSATQREHCHELLAAVGEVAWIEDEGMLDAVTAVSGGGPAYVFLLIECLAEAGAAAGLPPDLAMRLARVTVAGAGELARQSSEPASVLRQNVTSPGGTTLEALKILMAADGWQPLMTKAIAAATRRSRELAG